MLKRNQVIKGCLTETNRSMKRRLINVAIETEIEKEKNKDYYNNFSFRNKDNNIKFPNIKTNKKNNDVQTKYNSNLLSNLIKKLNFNSKLTETDNEIPEISSKINMNKNKYYFSNSVKKSKNTINNNFLDDVENSNLILSSVKTPKLNILEKKDISNINNIFNKNDFLKNIISSSSDKNNNRTTILIKNLKHSESGESLNEEEKNCISNILKQKTTINFKEKINSKPKKIKHKDEFKEFLKEILKQHKNKNINKVKKKIKINTLLYNKQIPTLNNIFNIRTNTTNFPENNKKYMKTTFINTNKQQNKIILRNEFLNSNLKKKNNALLTDEIKNKKRNIFDKYRFNINRRTMLQVEEELINLEDKIKENFDRYRKNVDDEPTDIS